MVIRSVALIVFLFVFILSLSGCANDPLIGTWYYSDEIIEDMEALATDPSDLPDYAFKIKSNGKAIGDPAFGSPVKTYILEGDQVMFYDESGYADPPLTIDGDSLLAVNGEVMYYRK